MPLKLTVTDLSEIAEPLRASYRPRTDGEGFILDVEGGVVAKSVHDEFRQRNIELTKRLSAAGETTPENVAELKEESNRLKAEIEKARSGASNDATAKIKALTTERDRYRQQLEAVVIDQQVTRVAAEIGAHPGALDDVASRVRGRFRLDDNGQPRAVDAQGNAVYGEDGAPLTITGAVRQLTAVASHLFKSVSGPGPNGRGAFNVVGNPWSKQHWNVTEQMKAIRADRAGASQMAAEAGHKI